MKKKKLVTALTTAAVAIGSLGLGAAPANAQINSGQFYTTSQYGVASQYHVYANNIDWNQKVGVVFYFDGDYWNTSQSKIYNYNNGDLKAMAAEANSRNMVFVPVVSPDKNAGGDGITWWENADFNGNWFRAFAKDFIASKGIDRSNVWTVGYSGGAEFQTFELGADRQWEWRSGGGNLIIGGGGSDGMQTTPDSATRNMPWYWYAGTADGKGVTWPTTWSAFGAAYQGNGVYKRSGFTNAHVYEQQGVDHYHYNFVAYLRDSFNRAGVAKKSSTASSGFSLVNGIRAYYYSHNGASVYGVPTSNEFPLRDGGVAQNFSRNSSIYWTPQFGTHGVPFYMGIGAKYKADGYENRYGFPATDEYAVRYGGAAQQFNKLDGSGHRFFLYWSPSTGTHSIYRNGSIGHRFEQSGWEAGLGFPVTDEQGFRDGAKQVFKNTQTGYTTAAYWSPQYGTHTSNQNGAILAKWAAAGDFNGYGKPITDEVKTGSGYVQYFGNRGWETGIYYSNWTGTHAINSRGGIYWSWVNSGYTEGVDFPVTDEQALGNNGASVMFKKANGERTLYTWNNAEAKVHKMNGNGGIYWRWVAEGGANKLGYPTNEEHGYQGKTRQDFSNGKTILWTPQTGAYTVDTSTLS